MIAKQVSVFLENRQGRLGEVLSVLKENKVNIQSISLADTTEYGLLRLIVNNPDLCKETLSKGGFSTLLTEVLVVKISHVSGSLQTLLQILADHMDIDMTDVIAFGDDVNDLGMLKLAGTAVAVSNAIDEVKAVADHVTDSNDQDGVAKFLEATILA